VELLVGLTCIILVFSVDQAHLACEKYLQWHPKSLVSLAPWQLAGFGSLQLRSASAFPTQYSIIVITLLTTHLIPLTVTTTMNYQARDPYRTVQPMLLTISYFDHLLEDDIRCD
jgi:hypothetical protein